MDNQFNKIAIIGVGLIGGSIAMGLKKHFGPKITIFGLCSTSKRGQQAVRQGIIDVALDSVARIPPQTDMIILAAPITINQKLLKKLKSLKKLNPKSLVIDVSSTKKAICHHAQKLKMTSFVGTHPMAGKDQSGFEAADPHLFVNKPWIITPSLLSNKYDIHKANEIVTILGANPIIMSPDKHDRLTTWASHVPLLMGSILIGVTQKQKHWHAIEQIATTGFRDTTRLASHDPNIKKDIVVTNQHNILSALCEIQKEINSVIRLVRRNQSKAILSYFNRAKKTRDLWLNTYSV